MHIVACHNNSNMRPSYIVVWQSSGCCCVLKALKFNPWHACSNKDTDIYIYNQVRGQNVWKIWKRWSSGYIRQWKVLASCHPDWQIFYPVDNHWSDSSNSSVITLEVLLTCLILFNLLICLHLFDAFNPSYSHFKIASWFSISMKYCTKYKAQATYHTACHIISISMYWTHQCDIKVVDRYLSLGQWESKSIHHTPVLIVWVVNSLMTSLEVSIIKNS